MNSDNNIVGLPTRWKSNISNTFQLQLIVLSLFYRNGGKITDLLFRVLLEGFKYCRPCLFKLWTATDHVCCHILKVNLHALLSCYQLFFSIVKLIYFHCKISFSFFLSDSTVDMINISCFIHLTFHKFITAGSQHSFMFLHYSCVNTFQ